MKKIIILVLMVVVLALSTQNVFAYEYFESYEKVGTNKLLHEYTEEDYQNNYKKVKRKFFDWSYYEVNRHIKLKFISSTLFHYYNNGKSPIEYAYKAETESIDSVTLKASGEIKVETQKNTKFFGDGLNFKLGASYENKQTEKHTETYDINVDIQPGNQMYLYMYGEGVVINGVAKKHFFFMDYKKGGYEIFIVTTHYQKLEVTPL